MSNAIQYLLTPCPKDIKKITMYTAKNRPAAKFAFRFSSTYSAIGSVPKMLSRWRLIQMSNTGKSDSLLSQLVTRHEVADCPNIVCVYSTPCSQLPFEQQVWRMHSRFCTHFPLKSRSHNSHIHTRMKTRSALTYPWLAPALSGCRGSPTLGGT